MLYNKEIVNRLKRIEGQIRGISKMMEAEKACADVVNQLSSIRSSTGRAIAYIVANELQNSLTKDKNSIKEEYSAVDDAVNMLVKSS
ncbi:metal-sensing transcriptional repressor [Bacillus sp. ISL-35]|uniref:metal-sensing transcriptional repressor n=1 Tax=Bacillus sp. ISL-35 TaxID=2819122 RepID=UPI001BEAA8FE|nr:metal-sensing transcriptional repressor [Bacillus sp. ISL-35]MBT2679607.1 metal-sensing transcriptional repressor [Bacillus sp. ISL-35]MBT2703513.1 metal-sensing transcriptional repressor [Chryseobacterium sp. ISL-80]